MNMMLHRRVGMLFMLSGCGACVSLNPSAHDVTGRWQVECEGGKETLDLKPDGQYIYTIESPRRRMRVEGPWRIEPPRSQTDTTHIVLAIAPQSCDTVDFFNGVPDNTLDPVWEWGHRELSFNHDEGGFRRISSP
jgi:hypothetical protein